MRRVAIRRVLVGAGFGSVAGLGAAPALALLGDTCGLSVMLDVNANCGDNLLACLLSGGGGGAAGGGLGSGDGRGGGGKQRQSPQDALSDPEFTGDMEEYADQWRKRNLPPEHYTPPPGPVKQYVDDLIGDIFKAAGDIYEGEMADRREAERQREIDRQVEQEYPDNQ